MFFFVYSWSYYIPSVCMISPVFQYCLWSYFIELYNKREEWRDIFLSVLYMWSEVKKFVIYQSVYKCLSSSVVVEWLCPSFVITIVRADGCCCSCCLSFISCFLSFFLSLKFSTYGYSVYFSYSILSFSFFFSSFAFLFFHNSVLALYVLLSNNTPHDLNALVTFLVWRYRDKRRKK